MTDLSDVVSAVEGVQDAVRENDNGDVVSALNEVRDAVKHSWSSWLWVIIGWFLVSGWIHAGWESKFRYSTYYGTTSENTTVSKEPHDCDFFKAPIGNKECHFEKEVSVTETKIGTDTGTGRPVVSYDGGKTWTWDDVTNRTNPHTSVFVSYTRVGDE